MTDLLLIRHAETALKGTFCGHADPPLSPGGLAQLPGLMERLRPFRIDAVYASDLRRAVQTASALADERSLLVNQLPGLREIHFGEWEELDWAAIEQRNPAFAARWVSEFPALPTPGGEPIQWFRQRVLDAAQTLCDAAAQSNLAVVTHAGVLRVLLEELGHLAPHHAWEYTREYTCVLHFVRTGTHGHLELRT